MCIFVDFSVFEIVNMASVANDIVAAIGVARPTSKIEPTGANLITLGPQRILTKGHFCVPKMRTSFNASFLLPVRSDDTVDTSYLQSQ